MKWTIPRNTQTSDTDSRRHGIPEQTYSDKVIEFVRK